MKYYVIDTETTGVRAKHNEITEIAIVRCDDLVQKIWNVRIKYPERAQKEALEVTGKTVAELMGRGKYIEEIVPMVNAFLTEDGVKPEERVMIAHNASFDQRFMEGEWELQGQVFPAKMWECTLSMARKYQKINNLKGSCKLEELIVRLGIKGETNFHGAAPDTRNTYRLRDFFLKNGMDELEFIKASKSYVASLKKTESVAKSELEADPAMDEMFQF